MSKTPLASQTTTTPILSKRSINIINATTPTTPLKPSQQQQQVDFFNNNINGDQDRVWSSHKAKTIAQQVSHLKLPSRSVLFNDDRTSSNSLAVTLPDDSTIADSEFSPFNETPTNRTSRISGELGTTSFLMNNSDKNHITQYSNMIRSTSLLKSTSKLQSTPTHYNTNHGDHKTEVFQSFPLGEESNYTNSTSDNTYLNQDTTLQPDETELATPLARVLGEISLPLYYLAPQTDIFSNCRQRMKFFNDSHVLTQQFLSAQNEALLGFGSSSSSSTMASSSTPSTSNETINANSGNQSQQLTPTDQLSIQFERERHEKQTEIDALTFMLSQVSAQNNGKLPKQYKDQKKLLDKQIDDLNKMVKKHQKDLKKLAEQEQRQSKTKLSISLSSSSTSTSTPTPHSTFHTNKLQPSAIQQQQQHQQSSIASSISGTPKRSSSLFRSSINKGSKANALLGFEDPHKATQHLITTGPRSTAFSPRTITAAKTVAPIVTIDTLLSHELSLSYLYLFVEKEKSVENLTFIQDVSLIYALYTDICTLRQQELDQNQTSLSITLFFLAQYFFYAASLIFEEYVCFDAPNQVNLPDTITSKLEQSICSLGTANELINTKIEQNGFRLAAEIEQAERQKGAIKTHQQHKPTLFVCKESDEEPNPSFDSVLHLSDIINSNNTTNKNMSSTEQDHQSSTTNSRNNFQKLSYEEQKSIIDWEMQTAFILSMIDINFDSEQGQYLENIMECFLASASEITSLLSRDTFMRFKKDNLWTQMVGDCTRNNLSSLFFPSTKSKQQFLTKQLNHFFKDRINNTDKKIILLSPIKNPSSRYSFASPRKNRTTSSTQSTSPRKSLLSPTKVIPSSPFKPVEKQHQPCVPRTVKVHRNKDHLGFKSPTPSATPLSIYSPTLQPQIPLSLKPIKPLSPIKILNNGNFSSLMDSPSTPITSNKSKPTNRNQNSTYSPFLSPSTKPPPSPAPTSIHHHKPASFLPPSLLSPSTPRLLSPTYQSNFQFNLNPNDTFFSNFSQLTTPTTKISRKPTRYSFGRNGNREESNNNHNLQYSPQIPSPTSCIRRTDIDDVNDGIDFDIDLPFNDQLPTPIITTPQQHQSPTVIRNNPATTPTAISNDILFPLPSPTRDVVNFEPGQIYQEMKNRCTRRCSTFQQPIKLFHHSSIPPPPILQLTQQPHDSASTVVSDTTTTTTISSSTTAPSTETSSPIPLMNCDDKTQQEVSDLPVDTIAPLFFQFSSFKTRTLQSNNLGQTKYSHQALKNKWFGEQ